MESLLKIFEIKTRLFDLFWKYTRIFDKYKLPIYPVVIYLYPDRLGFDIPDSYVSSVNNKDILPCKNHNIMALLITSHIPRIFSLKTPSENSITLISLIIALVVISS